jgi:hypothetical protein
VPGQRRFSLKVLALLAHRTLISQASFHLANILVEEFRNTRDPMQKMTAQGEMKALAGRMSENMGPDFDWTQSQTNIPLAYMTRRLAAVEFQKGLNATFMGCFRLLRDSTAANDGGSLRILARVLAYVPELELDAEIAATCQLYILDVELHKKENTDEAETTADREEIRKETEGSKNNENCEERPSNTGNENEITTNGSTANDNGITTYGSTANGSTSSDSSECIKTNQVEENGQAEPQADSQKQAAKEVAEGEEYLDPDASITCTYCSADVDKWSGGPVYLCYICSEMDICSKVCDMKHPHTAVS